ncbi:MAG: hypothetical protein GY928_10215 [Colwellia sp.]|nr:hypothetical protein [Colwellia sp.]
MIKTSYLSTIIVIGSSILLFLASCTLLDKDTLSSCDETELPIFLGKVWPAPTEVIDIEAYNRKKQAASITDSGIGVTIIPSQIDSVENLSQDANTAYNYYAKISTLYLDGEELSKEDIHNFYAGTGIVLGQARDENGNMLQYDAGPYYITWLPTISPGTHEANFNLINKEEETFEFSWCFTIAEN